MNSWPKLRWKIACFRNKTTQKISSLRTAIVYENFIFTQEYAFAERCCFLIFSFEGKFRKYDISVKRKHAKTNENMIFYVLFTNFRLAKILIFMQCCSYEKNAISERIFIGEICFLLRWYAFLESNHYCTHYFS